MNKKCSVLMMIMLVIGVHAFAADYPKPASWVNDYAGVLTDTQQNELDEILKNFETQTTNQIFVCIMSNLPAGTIIEDYVNDLFAQWKPGQKGKDNGALLAIFINNRMMRIEVGYGLEAQLTDAASKLIIANEIAPSFKQGNYYQGIKNGINGIIHTIKGDYTPSPLPQDSVAYRPISADDLKTILSVIILIVMIILRIWAVVASGEGWTVSSSGYHHHQHSSRSSWGGSSSSRSSGFSGGGGRSGGGGASGGW